MALNREAKAVVIGEVSAQVAQAQSIILAEYRGLNVANITALRRKARDAGVYLRVMKNTLVRRAVAETPFALLADRMSGPLIYGISRDPVSAAKVMNDFAKTNDAFVIKAGAMPNHLMDASGRQVRAHPQRSAVEVCPHGGCVEGTARIAGDMTFFYESNESKSGVSYE